MGKPMESHLDENGRLRFVDREGRDTLNRIVILNVEVSTIYPPSPDRLYYIHGEKTTIQIHSDAHAQHLSLT